jgi:aryl-alcohol dehydrogenase-like predicted oxidoreductase
MASGLLSGAMTRERLATMPDDDWRRRDERFREPQLSKHLALVDRLRAVGERHEATPGQVAIAWTLRNPAVTAAIVGMRRPDQVLDAVEAAGLELSDDEVQAIEHEETIR